MLKRGAWTARVAVVIAGVWLAVPDAAHVSTHAGHELCRLLWKPGNTFTRVAPLPRPAVAYDGPRMLNVTYTGFSDPAAQAAFDYAVQILEAQMRSRVPLAVSARMEAQGGGVLGSASTGVLTPSWTPAAGGVAPPIFEAFYPFPLADHLQNRVTTTPPCGTGEVCFPFHFTVTMNATPGGNAANWYYGLDGATPANRIDFVSVALHELVHGVGFAGQARVVTASNSNWTCDLPPCGSVLLEGTATQTRLGFSAAWEYFLKSAEGISLRDSNVFPHLSQVLGNQLMSNVFFDGFYATHANGGTPWRVYTPNPFAGGSSIGHVDEVTYAAGHVNSLMSPFLGSAEAIHSVGPVALGTLADVGWDACAVRLGSLTQVLPRGAGSTSISITVPSYCAWTVTNAAPFLTLTSATTGTGSSTAAFTVAANNTGSTRQGTVTINGIPHVVSQAGGDVAAVINASPLSTTIVAGQPASFTIVAGGDPAPTIQWQRSTDGGTTFTNLAEGAPFSGTTSQTLSIAAVTAAMHLSRFRAVATNGVGSPATSDSATLTVQFAPIITTHPASVTSNPNVAGTFTVAATANPTTLTYQWQRSSDGGLTWTDITDGAPYFFSTTPTLEVTTVASIHGMRFRCRVTNSVGSTTTNAATLSIRLPVTMSPSTLRFSGTQTQLGGALTTVTAAQTVNVVFAGLPGEWTATPVEPWVVITNGTGNGNGQFQVSISTTHTGLSQGEIPATVELRSTAALSSPVGMAIWLTVRPANSATVPFGELSTPSAGAANLSGAIAVTGWALDDIGVERVEIWRNCLTPIDSARAGVCRNATPTGAPDKVFVGNAAFVPGARTDIENNSAYSSFPQAYRAGWGYLLLTNALPNQSTGATEGGQGPVTLYAYAIDREGRYTELGARNITLDNANATTPFGAIDTPEQGGTVTGALTANFGWAMTRRQNASGVDVPKCIERSRYRVYIDGVPRTLTTGVNWHPNLSRADLTAAYPGLCDSANPLAAYYIDVTALGLSNGTHTIGWDVYDDNGTPADPSDDNVAGIGSRFFDILVGGADAPLRTQHPALPPHPALRTPHYGVQSAAEVNVLPVKERRELVLEQGRRLDVDLGGAVSHGYQVVGDQVRDLPIGSTLDAANGRFYWEPPVPFFGVFTLEFVSGTDHARERTRVTVTITDPTARGEAAVTITSPRAGANPNPIITVTGTARDPQARAGTGIDTVHIWARRLDGPEVQGSNGPRVQFLGQAQLSRDGYTLTSTPLAAGTYQIEVYAWVARLGEWAPAATVTIAVR